MNKLIYTIFIIGIILLGGCSSKQDNTVNEESTKIEQMPLTGNYNYSSNDMGSFIEWINDENSVNVNQGAFRELIEIYKEKQFILSPKFNNRPCDKVFIDSNQKCINYMFTELGIRVNIEPLEIFNRNIVDYFKEELGYEFNKKMPIINEEESNLHTNDDEMIHSKTGYEYDCYMLEEKNIQFNESSKVCVLETKYSEKSSTLYNLAFIEKGMIVRIIYYETDKTKFEISKLKEMSFDELILN